MKPGQVYLPPKHRIILLVTSLLLATSGLAQQAERETQEVSSPEKSSKTDSSTEEITSKAQETRPTTSEPATRFTPSEKIHADDAVSFPVDI